MHRLHPLRCAKISNLVISEPVHEQIRRLDVTVDDAPLLAVHQSPANVLAQLRYLPDGRQGALAVPSRQDFLQALEQLHSNQKGARLAYPPVSKIFYTDDIRGPAKCLHDLDLAAQRFRDIGTALVPAV